MKKTVLKIKEIQPLFTKIVCTSDKYTKEDSVELNGLVTPGKENTIKNIQTVVAVGTNVMTIKPGDLVSLSFNRYAVRKTKQNSIREDIQGELYEQILSYSFPIVKMEDKDFLFIDSADVEFIITKYEPEEIEVNIATHLVNPSGGGSNLIV